MSILAVFAFSLLHAFLSSCLSFFFFFNDTATTEIYTLSLHDALPISIPHPRGLRRRAGARRAGPPEPRAAARSEEHTSELQSLAYLVCRLLLEKKKKKINDSTLLAHQVHQSRRRVSMCHHVLNCDHGA